MEARKLELYGKMVAMAERVKREKRLMTRTERSEWDAITAEFDRLCRPAPAFRYRFKTLELWKKQDT